MLNLLKYRNMADYSLASDLNPVRPITGKEAFFMGKSSRFLLGPELESWDAVLLVKYQSVETFLAMIFDEGYLAGTGHRIAALEYSRLLPTEEGVIY
jgi:hypothetical protein